MSERFSIYRNVMSGHVIAHSLQSELAEEFARDAWRHLQEERVVMVDISNINTFMEAETKALPLEEIPSIPAWDWTWMECHVPGRAARGAVLVAPISGAPASDDSRVMTRFAYVVFAQGKGATYPDFVPCYSWRSFDRDGVALYGEDLSMTQLLVTPEAKDHEGYIEMMLDITSWMSDLAMYAFAFTHCKNVAMEEHLPKRHEQRAAKRNGLPILKYRQIVINPDKPTFGSRAMATSNPENRRSLHIARGHFAHYTEDRKLFGKHAGRFWIPTHVRGSADVGTVVSSYRVDPTKEEPAQ